MPLIELKASPLRSLTEVNWKSSISKLGNFLETLQKIFILIFYTVDLMNEIIKVSKQKIGDNSINSVSARDLHRALEIKKDFTSWVKAQVKRGMFDENIDYIVFTQKGENLSGGRPSTEYIVTIDTAKHIALMSGTVKGKEVRNYFIEIEKRYFEKSEKIDLDYLLEASEKLIKLANLFGFSGNQAFLSADKGVRKITGNSPLEILDEKHLVADSKSQVLTPTQIGQIIEKSAMEVNLLLQDLGFQKRIEKVWHLTEKGEEFAEMLDTNKKHSDGTPVKQIKWRSEVLEKLKVLVKSVTV